jgi:predicted NACHT family NTPase
MELAGEALTQLREQSKPLEALPLPIHLEMANLVQPNLPNDLAAALMELLRTRYALSARLEAWMQAKLKSRDCWLILDGLNQVPEVNRSLLRERLSLLETQPGWCCRVVLACRTASYDRALVPWKEVTEYELAPFRSLEIRQFVMRWFEKDKERGESLCDAFNRNYSLRQVCHTPLLVTLTCLAHKEVPVTAETRRVELYAHILRALVRRAWKENPLDPLDPHIGDVLRPLPAIARKLFERRPESNLFSENEVYDAIKTAPDLPSAPIPFRQELIEACA